MTARPSCCRCRAVASPTRPPPTTSTSAIWSASSTPYCGRFAVASHTEPWMVMDRRFPACTDPIGGYWPSTGRAEEIRLTKVTESVRSEADEYRQGADRPLGGYALAMTVFAGVAGLVGAIAALRGTTSRRISAHDLLLMTAGTHKPGRRAAQDAHPPPAGQAF